MPSSDLSSVLLVEDDQSLRRVLHLSLGRAGFEVAEVASGGKALDVLEKEPLDAVLLDLCLSDSLGGAVLEHLRRLKRKREACPALVVISGLDREDVARLYGTLDAPFLAKPFNPKDLGRMLTTPISAKGQPQQTLEESRSE